MNDNKRDWSCPHGSRWIWWPGLEGEGEWKAVVIPTGTDAHGGPYRICDCFPPGSKRQGGGRAVGPELS